MALQAHRILHLVQTINTPKLEYYMAARWLPLMQIKTTKTRKNAKSALG
jgi:hypothetical protein